MKAKVNFFVDVYFLDGKPEAVKPEAVEAAVAEAMTNAVRFAEGEGHIHKMVGEDGGRQGRGIGGQRQRSLPAIKTQRC